ncbi:regulator complex protein LAMTOR5 [Nitzschia inconspicua]|uniref:Regulator complex protein LAMTOR5 n=1 Tax=Nitzschia inconspicua TaxID=303405 RepID=A0A9K3Q2V6_9STRA|nr:regulator complex protein LAMTOR5 [Nitzschia inconspicua]
MSSAQQQPQGKQQQSSSSARISPLVESLISGGRAGLGGILVNDVNGLCLVSKGDMPMTHDSGVYTNLTRLASKLTPDGKSGANSTPPLITIEMDGPASLLIKEYDGHTVAMKVPNA